jgi:hypothetical protein
MDNFIFQADRTNEKVKQENQYFCIDGKQDFFDNDGYPRSKEENSFDVAAKKIVRIDNSIRYMIRIYPDGKMYNPVSIYDYNKANKAYKVGTKFREVSYKSFNMYLSFLKTKNTSWLYNAEREAE